MIISLKNKIKDIDKKTLFALILGYVLLVLYQRYFVFGDEADNILGGISVINGRDIYSGFFSQHVPFAYYFSALIAFFGASNYETYRFWMSVALLFTWIFMFFSYSELIGKNVLRIFVILYPLTINFHLGQMILSDVFQGYALLILLMELIKFWKLERLSKGSIFTISASFFIASMSAVISIYPLFIFVLGFTLIAIKKGNIQEKYKDYLILIFVSLLPFIFLFGWYFFTGNIKNFYEQSYAFNRNYYSKYLGGLGSSALKPFLQTPRAWLNHISKSLINFDHNNPLATILVIFNLAMVYHFYKKDKLISFIIFIFITFTGIRSFTDFHGAPYYFVSLFSASFLIDKYLIEKSTKISSIKYNFLQLLTFFLLISIIPIYLQNINLQFLNKKESMASGNYDSYTQKITKSSDKVWYGILIPQTYIKNHRQPASRFYSVVPWVADAYSSDIINDLKKNKPKLIVFSPESEVWGYKYSIFAAEIYNYIKSNYTVLNTDDPIENTIYIKNDDFNRIEKTLWPGTGSLRDGTLISDSLNIYIIDKGLKRHIATEKVFKSYGYKWSDIKQYTKNVVESIKSGKPIDVPLAN